MGNRHGVANRGPLDASREYASKHEYLEEFVKPFGARFLASERFRPTNIRSVHADGNTVIVLWDGRGIAIDGKPYENTYAFFMQMRDGKVVDVTALTDSISLNELFVTRPARNAPGCVTSTPSLSGRRAGGLGSRLLPCRRYAGRLAGRACECNRPPSAWLAPH